MWYRIFARGDHQPAPASLLETLQGAGFPVAAQFKGDDLGWTSATLELPGGQTPLMLERFLTEADDLRDDLNTWAAELETLTYSPNAPALMEWVIQTRQLFTLRKPLDHSDEITLEKLCLAICVHLAEQTDGVYQIDGQGWFSSRSELLVQEY